MTIDANVFVSALSPSDAAYQDSLTFLNRIRTEQHTVVCPSLVLPECAGAVMRPTGSTLLTQRATVSVQTLPGIVFVPLTTARAEEAARVATYLRLRAPDAVYVAVAQEFGTTLITWDAEVLTRGAQAVPVMTPGDWLAANPTI